MDKALILHSVEDARHCIRNRLYRDNALFSTHSSVDVYLKELHGISCQCVSNFLTARDIENYTDISSRAVDRISEYLDSKIAPFLNERFNLKMRYFMPLYSYYGRYLFFSHLCFVNAVKKLTDFHKLKKISFYNCKCNVFFNTALDLRYLVSAFFDGLETEVLDFAQKGKTQKAGFKKMINMAEKIRRRPVYGIKRFMDIIKPMLKYRAFNYDPRKKSILLYEDLYELLFLREELPKKYNILYYSANSKLPFGFKDAGSAAGIEFDTKAFDFTQEMEDPFIRMFLGVVKDDFLNNISEYMGSLQRLAAINREYQISLGIWGNPPFLKGVKSLTFEYLKSESIPVVGGQHGGRYGDIHQLWHFVSDFARCDYFLSYGFGEDDLSRLYPQMKSEAKIIPVGKKEPLVKGKTKKPIDILFPMTSSIWLFKGGTLTVFPDKMTKIQIKILEYLNTLKESNVYIKPFAFSTYDNCSVLPVLKKLKNLKVVTDRTLTAFLEEYEPRIVIIEDASQPLYDIMHLDAQVFFLNAEESLNAFSDTALQKIKRRVHYCKDVEELISKLGSFLNGKLDKKRDVAFCNHYVYKKDRERNILKLIDSLVTSKEV